MVEQIRQAIGEQFHYSTLGVHLLSNIIKVATGMDMNAFATKYLFEPLGIREVPIANVYDRKSQEEYINAMLAEHKEGYGYLWWIYPSVVFFDSFYVKSSKICQTFLYTSNKYERN